MKKTLFPKLFLLLILLLHVRAYADDIWTKDFASDINKGYWGTNSDMIDVADWTLDISQCILADDADYVMVVGTSGGRMEAVDCDGEAIWRSSAIDISGYTNCAITILATETGSSANVEKYVKFYYQLDGGTEQAFAVNSENTGNWGSLDASVSGLTGNNLTIIVRMNNPLASNKVYFDDIRVTGDPVVVENNRLTVVKESEPGLGEVKIDTKANTKEEAISCFRFTIDETNNADDGKPTHVSRMTFFNPKPVNALNWAIQLGGVQIYADGNLVEPKSFKIDIDSMYFDFEEGQINIPEGESVDFELKSFLNSSLKINDHQKLQFLIRENARGFNAYPSGSGFNSMNSAFNSAIHSVDVVASEIQITDKPDEVQRNRNFTISATATDEFGNTDIDQSELLNLSLLQGGGNLISENNLEMSLVKGEVTFESLKYNIVESIRLAIAGETLPQAESSEIVITNSFQSEALPSNWKPANTLISSLITDKEDAIEVFRFIVSDSGQDEVSTILKKVPIIAAENNQVDFKKNIAGFLLLKDDRELDVNFSVEKDKLLIEFAETENARIIESESQEEFSLYTYLDAGKTGDGEILQLKIDKSSESWEISEKESGLRPEFSNDILGTQFILDVTSTEMKFESIPKHVTINSGFNVEIELLDQLGNRDINSEKQVHLSLGAGLGNLSASKGLAKSVENGLYIWNDLVYNKAEYFKLQAESDGLRTILSSDISAVDNNSTIVPGSMVGSISLNPLATNELNAITVLNFKVSDPGTYDDFPTQINTVKFYKAETGNSFAWEKHIAGAVIKSNGKIIATTTDIQGQHIRFYSSKGVIKVPSSTQQGFELAIYFRKSQLPDNANFKVHIPKEDFDWKTGSNSSGLAEVLDTEISSENHQINVVAKNLSVISAPFYITGFSEPFDLKIAACDEHQNIDTDYSGSFQLELINSDGNLSFDQTNLQVENGIAIVSSITYSGEENFNVRAHSELLADSTFIYIGTPTLFISKDFEQGDLSMFQNTADWTISNYEPIKDLKSVKHNLTNQSGSSYLTGELEGWKAQNGSTQWSFLIRNGDWEASSENFFVFHLLMNDSDPSNASEKYSIGVNFTGSTDRLNLWKTNKANTPELLIESDFKWNEQEKLAIQVTYTSNGKWILDYNRLGNEEFWTNAGEINSMVSPDIENSYYALQFNFETATRAGQLWFDNFKIQSVNTVPYVKSYEVIGQDSLLIVFSEDLEQQSMSNKENYKIYLNGSTIQEYAVLTKELPNEVILKFNEPLKTGNYAIEILNISDLQSGINPYQSILFGYLAPAKPFDIVINEIMADENPSNGLPEYEFIELYNTQPYPVPVENMVLNVSAKTAILKPDTIPANSYLILCSNSSVELFEQYGKTLGVSDFPSLANAGASIEILSVKGEMIDAVAYLDTWYKSEDKENGGWSLERIDPLNFAWQEPNWTGSVAKFGGTPGQQNSVYGENKDTTPPVVTEVLAINSNSVQIIFSEPMNEGMVLNHENYTILPDGLHPVNSKSSSENSVELLFEEDWMENLKYKVVISKELTDLAGNSLEENNFEFWVPAQPNRRDIVINEVLYHPLPGGVDYVELLNVSDKLIDLSQLYIGKRDENYQMADSVRLATNQKLLHPKSYLVVSTDTLNIAEVYHTSDPNTFIQLKLPNFPNESGRVVLWAEKEVIDEFEYDESMHFELLVNTEGIALERVSPERETNDVSNWQSAAQNVGFGTPGLENSVYSNNEIADTDVGLSAKLFSPDNDGIDDRLYINFNLAEDGYVANIRIYNSMGKEIRKLASNYYLGKKDQIYWDGLSASRERLPIGIYLVYVELFHPDGDVKSYKKTCVLGGKLK